MYIMDWMRMTFEAYMNNIRTKTGKEPKDFFEQAVQEGVLRPDTKTMEFVTWLKGSSGLGHGHAMAVWEAFKRNGWIPLSGSSAAVAQRGRR
jgi:hypothetical protein